MATRTELRGFLKQSQRTSEMDMARTNEKRSSNSRKECVKENDELVKYMSKVPCYLKGMERSEEIVQQSNVLNLGVLDWSRLEKWKHGRDKGGERSRKVSANSGVVVVSNDSHTCSSNLGKGKASRDLQRSSVHEHGVRCTLEPELASREVASCSFKSSGRDPGKSRKSRSYRESTSGLLSEMGNSGGSLGAKGDLVLRDKKIHTQEARERAKECIEKLDGEEKIVGKAGLTSEKEENHQCGDIVLLRSRKQSGSHLSGEPQMPREVTRSLDFSNGISTSLGSSSQIPRSCPLSFDLERDSEDTMLLPLGVDKKERFGLRRHSKTASRILDEETPLPSKRYSFSFGRLSRSFTLKEDTSGKPLTSFDESTVKSESMRFDGSVCPEKQNGSRVSPLRRLLDPLLKPKGSENVLPTSKARSSSVLLPDEEKQDTSRRTRALFQLTVRNGIPLFQFLVDDNNGSTTSILGATMNSSDSSLKDDFVQYCTFYSVNEVKKKKPGRWLIHGHSKEKQRGFVYNVIGQMRLSNSMTEQKSENIRESVLFDESEQVKMRKEVAAVVIKKKKKTGLEETSVIIPNGVHSFPENGAPSPLISRWRSGGLCDCGGWDVGCKLHVLSNKRIIREYDQSFKLFDQEGSEQDSGPVLAMKEVKTGIYRVEFSSFVSALQAFFVCVTVITCGSEEEEEETVLKTTGKSSSPFAPPLSPVGRV